jgi:hypothetical protein
MGVAAESVESLSALPKIVMYDPGATGLPASKLAAFTTPPSAMVGMSLADPVKSHENPPELAVKS